MQIENKDKYEYILTYSFPCQDISGAGLGKGFSKGSGTRSGLLWEIERILNELQVENALPQILLMENVPLIHSIENWSDFEAWKQTLKDLGYCNFWKDLTATDYGIPQTRTRTFMISILGDYNYEFPKPIPLEKNLKDLCDDEVDEKYYVTRKFYEYATTQTGGAYNRGKNFYQSLKQTNEKGIAVTLTTNNNTLLARDYKDPKCIIENKALKETLEQNDLSAIKEIGFVDSYNRDIKTDGTVGTITTRVNASNNAFLIERRNTNEEK